jgi:hypothetical protein
MELVQILLPLRDGQSRDFPSELYDKIASEMTERFGGVTAYTRTPAEGRWKPDGHKPEAEDVVASKSWSRRWTENGGLNIEEGLRARFGRRT